MTYNIRYNIFAFEFSSQIKPILFVSLQQRIKLKLKPLPSWGPSRPEDRKLYQISLGITELETVTTEKPLIRVNNGVYDETTVSFLPEKS